MEPFELLPYWDEAALDAFVPPRKGRAAYVELHNLIAAAEGPAGFGPEDLLRIGRRHGVDLRRAFRTERLALYATYLQYAFTRGFHERERATLAHLARTLFLDADDPGSRPGQALAPLHELAFGRAVAEALADARLSAEERLLLYTLQHTLGVDPAEAEVAYEAAARERLLVAVARALADGVLRPEEAAEVEALEGALDVRVPKRVAKMLAEAARRWRLRNGSLAGADVFVRLLPGEVGYFSTVGVWREVNYARLRVLLSQHREQLHRGDTTDLYVPEEAFYGRKWHEGHVEVTNKRLVLLRDGDEPVTYGLPSLVGAECYRNGVRVAVKGDRSFFLNAGGDNRTLYTVLWRALHPGRPLPEADA